MLYLKVMGNDKKNAPETEKKIIKEIEKTGYPTEMQSASKMINDGWIVIHNPSFLDKDEGTCREFDIEAVKTTKIKVEKDIIPSGYTPAQELEIKKGLFVYSGVRLICECKKSVKPWVFFISKEMHKPVSYSVYIKGNHSIDTGTLSNRFNARKNPNIFDHSSMGKSHHYFKNEFLARTYFEPFKGQENSNSLPQMIHSAVMSCIKATLYYKDYIIPNSFFINYPVIIFQGNLFTSSIVENKIKIEKASHIQLAYNYILPSRNQSPIGERHKFIIDIVNSEYLEDFLKIVKEELSVLSTIVEDCF